MPLKAQAQSKKTNAIQPKSESAIAAEKAQASLAEHREAKKRSFGASFRTRIKARKDKK